MVDVQLIRLVDCGGPGPSFCPARVLDTAKTALPPIFGPFVRDQLMSSMAGRGRLRSSHEDDGKSTC